jgi:hypothetical protein
MEILLAQGRIEAVGVAGGGDVGGWGAFAEHLRDGISGDQVDHQEDQAYDQPDDGDCIQDALEEAGEHAVVSGCFSVLGIQHRREHGKNALILRQGE